MGPDFRPRGYFWNGRPRHKIDTGMQQNDTAMGQAENWALILGGSRGLGLATAQKLGRHGYNLLLVHRDRKADLQAIHEAFEEIRAQGVRVVAFNKDAVSQGVRNELLQEIGSILGQKGRIGVLVHSLAKGHVKPMAGEGDRLTTEDFLLTIDAMAISWYAWTRDLIDAALLASDTRVLAFTSEGNSRVIPYYGAVSAAKAALEAIGRNMALEFAPLGIRVNCIQAGVTETQSFAMIPGSEQIKVYAQKRNPFGRLTRPEDVAAVVYLLTRKDAAWITGTVIKADGGESLR